MDDVSAEVVNGRNYNSPACLPDSPELALLVVKGGEILDEPCGTTHPAPLYTIISSCLIVLFIHSTCCIRFISTSLN